MGMRRPRFNMGKADWIGAESIGVPGQRTFRLLVSAQGNAAQLWLEKEQLTALAEAIARMIAEIDRESETDIPPKSTPAASAKPADFPANPEIEFHVGTLGLRYDPERKLVALEVFDRDAPEGGPPTLRCQTTRAQLETLEQESLEVVSAGRPRCPLCGTPLPAAGVPHFCPPTNGHQKLSIEDE